MKSQIGRRKRVRHFHDPGHVHELTFSCYERRPLLTNDAWRILLAECIDRAMNGHHYRLTAFVFMPEHVHLLVYPLAEASGIDALLKAMKRPFSYRLKRLLIASESPLPDMLTIQQRPGVTTFRFWQEGPGYDRNLTGPASVQSAIEYMHNNPVRRGLVKRAVDWKWSSARYYMQRLLQQAPDLPTLHPLPAEETKVSGTDYLFFGAALGAERRFRSRRTVRSLHDSHDQPQYPMHISTSIIGS